MECILETESLRKEFKGTIVIDGVNIKVREGDIHALIGPNGAGKTTFFNLLSKFLDPTKGRISYMGKDITRFKPAEVARLGMIRSFQISAVFSSLSVIENVRIALLRKLGTSLHFWRSGKTMRRLDAEALELLEAVDLVDYASHITNELPYGRKRALEIATTLAMDPKVMLLDEPTAGMGHEDVSLVTDLIQKVSGNRTILMVEHNMGVVEHISDTITVLSYGKVISSGTYAEVSKDPIVMEAYMGTSVSESEGG